MTLEELGRLSDRITPEKFVTFSEWCSMSENMAFIVASRTMMPKLIAVARAALQDVLAHKQFCLNSVCDICENKTDTTIALEKLELL